MPQTEINREHKDRLFRLLFGGSYSRQNLLDLYNALNDTNYNDPEELQVTTIEDVIYMGMKNDVSILLHSRMALYEHQSTYNPNMPVRGFLYAAKLYEKYIESNGLNIYGSTQVKLPVPQYVVFYNGSGHHEDEEILRLSDAFERKEDGEGYEWTARMLNINYGKNKKLMERCKALRDYAIFTDKVKKYLKQGMNTEQAINRAVEECIKEDVMSEFLIAHRAEVVDVCITEYNEERVMSSIREEGIREGRKEGIREGIEETFISLVIEGIFTDEVAADKSGLSLEEFRKKKEEYLRRKS
ncbi:MAG: hypothetical protein K2M46_12950 [Lachnospiraceae bacterium]|nr:hypothetical protein [Lachnospiraceae bacterium]